MRLSKFAPLCAVLLCACGGDDDDTRNFYANIYGEEFVEDSIPADEMEDGWEIKFDEFLLSISSLTFNTHELDNAYVFDLTQSSAGGHFVDEHEIRDVDHVMYTIGPSSGTRLGNVDQAKALELGDNALRVRGTANKGAQTITFDWSFTTVTTYHCHVDPSNSSAVITIHADHLFYDDLVSEEPALRFDAIAAADGDSDGVVTQAELEAVDLSTSPHYQVGNLNIDNLWQFLTEQTKTLGHINGEGHCDTN